MINLKIDSKAPIDRCPYCGSDAEYYTKDYVCGSTRCYQRFDGGEADNTGLYDLLRNRQGKYAYCANCDSRLFRINESEDKVNG